MQDEVRLPVNKKTKNTLLLLLQLTVMQSRLVFSFIGAFIKHRIQLIISSAAGSEKHCA